MDDEGHNYTFHVPWIPWHEQTDEQKGFGPKSKPYLEEVRDCLIAIMSERHRPLVVWEMADRALRLIDREGKDD